MRKTNKKGFTIVELVIVIAVVAILAAVLIPTFVSITKKANESSDISLVKNINLTLAAEEIGEEQPKTMFDALEMAERGGFVVENLTPRSSGYDIVWDSATNRFALMNGERTVFSEGKKSIVTSAEIWKIVEDENAASASTGYSCYIRGDGRTLDDFTVTTGVDVGKNIAGVITYNGTDKARNIVIRTDSVASSLKINGFVDADGKGDIISRYGKAGSVEIITCANESYHEYGSIGYAEIAGGHFVVENGAKVRAIVVTSETVKVDGNGGDVTLAYAKTTDIQANHKGNIELKYIYTDSTITAVKAVASLCEEGIGTERDPFVIGQDEFANVEKLDNLVIADVAMSNSPTRYYKLAEDIDFSEIKHNFTNQQCYITVDKVDINLNGKTIKNLDLPLAMYKNYLNIHNGKVELIEKGSIGIYYLFQNVEVLVKDIVFSGNISDPNGILGPIYASKSKITFENIKSSVKVNVVVSNSNAAGLIAGANANSIILLKNCEVYGNITTSGKSASGMINGSNLNFDNISIENSTYYGTINIPTDGEAYFCAPGYDKDIECSGGAKINKG